jgi:hypothetical protein
MPKANDAPTETELKKCLGSAYELWGLVQQTTEQHLAPINLLWKPAKIPFGRVGCLQHKGRTLLYLIPSPGKLEVSIVLGERAVGLALESPLPAAIKKLIREARPYVEGRGIRFEATQPSDGPIIAQLLACKTAKK